MSFAVSNSRFYDNCRLNGNLRSGANFVATYCDLPMLANSRVEFDGCTLASAPSIYGVIAGTYRDCRIIGARIDLGNSSSARFEWRTTLNGRPVPLKA